MNTQAGIPISAPTTPAPPTAFGDLPAFGVLFRSAWGVYKAHWTTLFPLFAIPAALGFIPLLGWVLSILAGLIAAPAVIVTLRDRAERLPISTAYQRGFAFILPVLWVGIIQGLVIFGGLSLLIIPGVLFGVLLSFSTILVVTEQQRGMNALLRSWTYVRSFWLKVFGRGILFLIIAILITVVIDFFGRMLLGDPETTSSLYSLPTTIVSALITPLGYAFLYLLYESIRTAKGGNTMATSSEGRGYIIGFAIFGIIAIITLLALGILTLSVATLSGGANIQF